MARVGIIGGGLGGLAAACTLAARGHAVTLFEANSWLGGKAAVLESDGYRFDMGPTILTVPSVLERIFAEAGRKLADYLDLVRLDPAMALLLHRRLGSRLEHRNRNDEGNDSSDSRRATVDGYGRFLALSARLHDISEQFFFWRSVGGLRDVFDWKNSFSIKTLGDVLAMRMGSTVARTVRSFVHDPRRRPDARSFHAIRRLVAGCVAGRAVQHRAHADGRRRLVSARRHRAVPDALAHLANELGVELHGDTEVCRIAQDRGRVSGIELGDGSIEPFDAVVSNMDVVRTHRDLLGDASVVQRFERRRRYEPACSGVVLYLGLNRAYDHLAPSQLRLLGRSARGIRRHLQARRTCARSDVLRRRAGANRSQRRTTRRRRSVRTRAHAVPAARPRLDEDAAGLSASHSQQTRDDRRHDRFREPHSV